MKKLVGFIALLGLLGCAHGKMGMITKPLDHSKISKSAPLYVFPVTTKDIRFSGDKAEETPRLNEEKATINDRFHKMIVMELQKKGYNAKPAQSVADQGFGLKGNVSRFDHGSGAARALVGMGAGSSNMYTDFKVYDMSTKKVLAEFEVIATSGGRGGLSAMSSFMEAHLIDGSEQTAEYIAGEKD